VHSPRTDRRHARRAGLLATAIVALAGAAAGAASEGAAAGGVGGTPDQARIVRSLETLRSDPNLATTRTISTLHWVDRAHKAEHPPGSLLTWIATLFAWFAQTTRVLVWVAVAVLAAVLVIYVYNLLRARRDELAGTTHRAPSFVRDLDIRPESLPADIGVAARRLWDAGEQRAALALLYRGLLSRLANVHGVQIRASSTEGECLALAEARLDPGRGGFVSELIRIWQVAVYGGRAPADAAVHTLCEGFAAALDPPA
jgi:Domain of unknown function (DUF4129)